MSFDTLLSDLCLVIWIIGVGFFFRLGMCGFDAFASFLTVHFQKKKP